MYSYKCCLTNSNEGKNVGKLAALLKVAGEESHLKLLCILRQGERCVCEIGAETKLSQSLTSHQLRDLKEIGMVTSVKDGLFVRYSLTKKGNEITNLLFKIKL